MIIVFEAFPVEIWGNVSEWVMILVTAVTGFLIFMTLREQKKVTILQHKKFLYDIKPIFDFNEQFGNNNYNQNKRYEIVLVQNVALKLKILNNNNIYKEIFVGRNEEIVSLGRSYDIIRNSENKFSGAEIDIDVYSPTK